MEGSGRWGWGGRRFPPSLPSLNSRHLCGSAAGPAALPSLLRESLSASAEAGFLHVLAARTLKNLLEGRDGLKEAANARVHDRFSVTVSSPEDWENDMTWPLSGFLRGDFRAAKIGRTL